MSISSALTPSAFISLHALDLVLSLVAKPGIVYASTFCRGKPSRSIVRQHDDQRLRRIESARKRRSPVS